jgi:hypothetical protein
MPYDEPDPDDPTTIVGVHLPGTPESTSELVYALAEEFAGLGHDREWILRLLRNPFYAGAHRAYLDLGDEQAQAIVDECVAVWGRVTFVDRVPVTFNRRTEEG